MSFYFLGDASCIETKVFNKHMTQQVLHKFRHKVKSLGLEEFADYVKILTDTWKASRHLTAEDTDEHKKCANRFEKFLLDYRNNLIFTPVETLKLFERTNFNIYSCQVDLLRDESYLMDMMLNVTGVKHSHFSIGNCYHGSFSDNTKGGITLRKKVIETMNKI